MKFVVEQAGRAGERAGQLELAARTFATPLPLLHSRGGAIPHLTQETLLYLENSGTVQADTLSTVFGILVDPL
jgi:hypothetical protein